MVRRLLIALGLAGMLGAALYTTLEKKVEEELFRTINGQTYSFHDGRVAQLTSDDDDTARYGVISDAHGEVEKARTFAKKFKEMGVDGIIVPGDIVNNEGFSRRGQKWDDADETEAVLRAIAETGLPVFVIPGNHDRIVDYKKGLGRVAEKHPHVVDMSKYRVFNGDDVDFVSLPGYTNPRFTAPGAFYADPAFVRQTGKLREGLDDPVVLIAHGAGRTNTDGKAGPATVYNGQDVGDNTTAEMMREENIPYAVVGNIHEAGGFAATPDGTLVAPGEWKTQFTANFGGLEQWKHLDGKIHNGMAGIFTVKAKVAKFDMLYLRD